MEKRERKGVMNSPRVTCFVRLVPWVLTNVSCFTTERYKVDGGWGRENGDEEVKDVGCAGGGGGGRSGALNTRSGSLVLYSYATIGFRG